MKILFILLSLKTVFAADPTDHTFKANKSTIIWVFSSLADKNPTVQTSLITNRHELFRLYYKDFSDYNHITLAASLPRIEHELKTKSLACYPGSSEAERRKSFSYLTPQYIQPSPRLVLKNQLAEKILKQDRKSISLHEIINDDSLIGVGGLDRSYGPAIDKILSNKPVHFKTPILDTFGPGALEIIETGKADYTIEYGFIFNSLKENNSRYKNLISVAINDIPPFIVQYLACSKTTDGLAIVKRADQLIRQNVSNTSYWKGVMESIPLAERANFQKEVDKFIATRTKSVEIIE